MIVAAPAARPAITAAMPTAPVPKTAMLDPAPTSNALRTTRARGDPAAEGCEQLSAGHDRVLRQ